jgi:hypothetical protein
MNDKSNIIKRDNNSTEIEIKSKKYFINVEIVNDGDNDDKLIVELEEIDNADTWKGVFDSSCNYSN